MILRRFLPIALVLLLANPARAQLSAPEPDRAADYAAWFGDLAPDSGLLLPSLQTPEAYDFSSSSGVWIHWLSTGDLGVVLAPILTTGHSLTCEIIFLGCTGPGWNSFGYTISGTDHSLVSDLSTLSFGDYIEFQSPLFSSLNVFVGRDDGTRYDAFAGTSATEDLPGTSVSIYVPLASTREYDFYPYTIFAFSPDLSAADPAVFVFAISAGYDGFTDPVPEPATYGLLGAAVLLGLAMRRSRRRRA